MSHLPSDDQLRRIERGVQRRIDLRRLVARRVAGTAASLVVLVGGIALVGPLLFHSSSGASTSAAGGSAARGSALVPVTCHGVRTTTVRAVESALPESAFEACATAFGGVQPATAGGTNELDGASASPAPTAPRPVLCRADDGALAVYPGGPEACAAHDLTPYAG